MELIDSLPGTVRDTIFILAGLVLLYFGGEGLIRGSVSLAARLGVSTFLIGAVVVGFGTSTPELLVSLQAALGGSPDIALGNVVGSNIANILLILGISALLSPVVCTGQGVRRDALAGVAAAALLGTMSFAGHIGRPAGAIMTGILAGYVFYCYRAERAAANERGQHLQEDMTVNDGPGRAVLFILGGLGLLLAGANLLVDGAVSIARAAGISEAVIGLTLVAVGTSLPELAASVIAAMKKHSDVAIGNILGSNLFNALFILGVTSVIAPIPFAGRIAAFDVWAMLAVSVLLLGVIVWRGKIGRAAGSAFLALYAAYCGWLFIMP